MDKQQPQEWNAFSSEFSESAHEKIASALRASSKLRTDKNGVNEIGIPSEMVDEVLGLEKAFGATGTALALESFVYETLRVSRKRRAYFEASPESMKWALEGEIEARKSIEQITFAYYAALTAFVSASLSGGEQARSRLATLAANAKAAKSKTILAKMEAIKLWPEAHRKGWTAERMWTALSGGGHTVKPDTVRKWMTSLRKTGTC